MVSAKKELQFELDKLLSGQSNPVILEAGCGSGSNITIPPGSRIVGIDISPEELEKNSIVHEKIIGDIQTYKLPSNFYDLIICWDVLEHLSTPELALDNFANAVKPGGLLLLAFPNVYSIKALVAKCTPHWFHIWIYKRIYGRKYGSPGLITFPTYLRKSIAPDAIREFASKSGFTVVFDRLYESAVQIRFREKYYVTKWRYSVFKFFSELGTLNTHRLDQSDCIFVLKRIDIS